MSFSRQPAGLARNGALVSIVLAVCGIGGCSKKAAEPPPRYAFLRFENLTGDASKDWIGRAASELLSRSLAGALDGPVIAGTAMVRLVPTLGQRPTSAPGISAERSAAEAGGATHVVTGYIESTPGGLRISAVDEELATQKRIRSFSSADAAPLKAIAGLGRQFSPNAKPWPRSDETTREYMQGLEAPPDQAAGNFERAVRSDPGFGQAWVSLIGIAVGRGDRDQAQELIARAREQKLDALDAADIDFQSTELTGDGKQRLAALRKVSSLSPGDTTLLRKLAETEMAIGEYRTAAEDWKRLGQVLPNDADPWNQAGYALAWAGDYNGAVAAMHQYARALPNDVNALDSLGDVHYLYRKFGEAAQSYSQASAKDPAFARSIDYYKTAWARFAGGDLKAADSAFAQYRQELEKLNTSSDLVQGDWLYRTGRKAEGIAVLRKALDSSDPAVNKPGLRNQLAVWELLGGDREAAAKEAAASGAPTTPAAVLVRFAAMPSATAAEWETRAERLFPQPAARGLRELALGYALLLDGKKSAAVPIWQELADASPLSDFFPRAMAARLKGEQPKFALLPDPVNLNLFAAVLESLAGKP